MRVNRSNFTGGLRCSSISCVSSTNYFLRDLYHLVEYHFGTFGSKLLMTEMGATNFLKPNICRVFVR